MASIELDKRYWVRARTPRYRPRLCESCSTFAIRRRQRKRRTRLCISWFRETSCNFFHRLYSASHCWLVAFRVRLVEVDGMVANTIDELER